MWEEENLGVWRRYTKLHTEPNPTGAPPMRSTGDSGMPILRALALAFPDDEVGAAREDQFMAGPDLLAAPVLTPGATRRRLHLPAGAWIDWWRSVHERPTDGGFDLAQARLLKGPTDTTLPAPRDQLPLLVRAGAVLPLLSADVDTLADRYAAPGVVTAAQRESTRSVLAFPRGTTRRRMGDGERLTSIERRGRWELRVRGKRRRTYRLQASVRAMRTPFVPARVTLSGRPVKRRRWSYDVDTGGAARALRHAAGHAARLLAQAVDGGRDPLGSATAAMRFFEYESRQILQREGIPVAEGGFATDAEGAKAIAAEIGGPVVIKSQVLTGGRMKAGGVKFADTPEEAEAHAARDPRARDQRPHAAGRADRRARPRSSRSTTPA